MNLKYFARPIKIALNVTTIIIHFKLSHITEMKTSSMFVYFLLIAFFIGKPTIEITIQGREDRGKGVINPLSSKGVTGLKKIGPKIKLGKNC